MKKTLLWGAIASLFFVSCSKNELVEAVEPSCDFVASVADQTRTELDGTSVIWNAEDELTIFTKTMHNRHYKVKTLTEDGRTATFGFVDYTGTSNGTISANYAVYPYDAQATLNGDVISTIIASEQQYNAEKVDLSYALMAAKSENTSFAFVNAGALMRFNISKSELIPDSYTLNSIKLSSAANNIAGDVTIDLSAESRAVVASTGTKEISLTAINQEITTEAKAFYVALPAFSFADKDLTVTFTFADGEKSFALPAFDLLQGSIKTIAYQINDSDDFTGTTPDSGEDFEGETPGTEAKPANNEIWYTNGSTTEATTPNKTDVFGANIVSNTYDATKECWVIKFDGDVTSIGNYAFNNDKSLKSVNMPNSVITIGEYAFNCNLTSISMSDNLTSIGDNAFSGSGLTEVSIPSSVKVIGTHAFYYNNNLESVTIDNIESFGDTVFGECYNLREFKGKLASDDGRCLIKDNTILYYANASGSEYVIPDGVHSIGAYAFYYCSNIENITTSNSVTIIEENAFYECENLSTVTISDGVQTIGDSAFSYCSRLRNVYCKPVTPPTRRAYSEIFYRADNVIIRVPTASVDTYKAADGWKQDADRIVGYDF